MRKSAAVAGLFAGALMAALIAPGAMPADGASVSAAPSAAGLRAGSGVVLPVGSQVTLPAAGVKLTAPADGRLWGYDFTGGVSGVAFTATAGTGHDTVAAPTGAQLCVFDLAVDFGDAPFLLADQSGGNNVTAVVTAGSRHISLPVDADSGQYQAVTAVAVPDGAAVSVAVTYIGVTQALDLRTGRRIGYDPPALYRPQTAPPYLTDRPGITGTLTQTGPAPSRATAEDQVSVPDAYLSWFPPDTLLRLPPVGDGYLIVFPQGGSAADVDDYETLGLPASAVTLVLPDGRRVAGGVTGRSPQDGSGDLFGGGGAYYFVVPADFTGGTIDIHATGPLPVDYAVSFGSGTSTLALSGTVQIPVSFPASTPTAQASPRPATPGRTAPGGGSGLPAWAIALIAAAVVVLAGIVLRARRDPGIPARPVTRPLALVAGPTVALHGPRAAAVSGVIGLDRGRVGQLGPAPPPPHNQASDDGYQFEDTSRGEADPGRAPGPAGPVLVVRVLGPLDVEGLTARLRRRPARRLLVCLAVWSGRPLTGDQLRNALATSANTEPSADSLRTFASALRAALPAGVLPPAGPTGGYQLVGDIDIDWALFITLIAEADVLPAGADRLTLVTRALRLVRGVPLAGDTWAGIDQTARHIETTVERAAADGARLALELRDARTAETLVTQGLLAAPGSPLLWELRLIAAAAGSGVGLDRAWLQAGEALGADASMLTATYERLRTGQF